MSGEPQDLWTFALETYARPGVEAACLSLQERRGLDVDLLLLACWLGRRGVRLPAAHLPALEAEVAALRNEVIVPLREIRRRMKRTVWPDGLAAPAEGLRAGVKRLEIDAERAELEALERATRDLQGSAGSVVEANLGLFGDPATDPDLEVLVAAAG